MVNFKLHVTETTVTLKHVIYHNRYKACGVTPFLFKKKGQYVHCFFLKLQTYKFKIARNKTQLRHQNGQGKTKNLLYSQYITQ